MQPSLRMNDFCVVYAESLGQLDVRRFVTFGLIHDFLRRVHRYPIYVERPFVPNISTNTRPLGASPPPLTLTPPSAPQFQLHPKRSFASTRTSTVEKDVLKMMDGQHHTDEICTTVMIRYTDLENIMAANPHCYVVHH